MGVVFWEGISGNGGALAVVHQRWGIVGVARRDPKVLRRVSRILIKKGLHVANLFYIFK